MAFPLRLCPFEEYLLLDDRPSFPMNFFLRLKFDGRLRYDSWNTAIARAIALHPLLHANVTTVAERRISWIPADEPPPEIELGEELYGEGTRRDLERETGLRITATEHDHSFSLQFQFHHSCCDGHGACQFINDVLREYAGNSGGAVRSVNHGQPNLFELRRRGRFGLTPLKFAKLAPRQLVGLLGARQFMMRNPQPLADGSPAFDVAAPPPGYPATITHCFSAKQTRDLLRRTKQLAVTLNDLAVRDLLLSIDEFKSRTDASDDHWLRLTVPVSLRDDTHSRMPATNMLSFVFLERQRSDMCDPNGMLINLSKEMKLIKRNKLGLTFVLSLAAVRSVTGSLARLMPRDQDCLATAVLTNPGTLFQNSPLAGESGHLSADDIRLADVEFIAPFRPNTCAAFSVYTYANQLRITLHFDSRSLGKCGAQKLHANFVRRLSEAQA